MDDYYFEDSGFNLNEGENDLMSIRFIRIGGLILLMLLVLIVVITLIRKDDNVVKTVEIIDIMINRIQQNEKFSNKDINKINKYFDIENEDMERIDDNLSKIYVNYLLDKPDLKEEDIQQIVEKLTHLKSEIKFISQMRA